MDAAAASKLLETPQSLTRQNAIAWLSFLRAFETDAGGTALPMASEVCLVLQNGGSLSRDPISLKDIAPNLPKSVVLFLLTSLGEDASGFITVFDLDPSAQANTIEPDLTGSDYMELAAGIRISDWNVCEIQPEFYSKFPFLHHHS
jgi:hypothetical protein